MFALIVIIGVLLTLVSCTPSPESAILDTAESLLAEQPDSAYLLLAEMDGSLLPVGSKLQARYALLYTQAQYKSYHDPANDSLISIAADYYEEHGNETERFYAYLYQGIIQYLLNDNYKASVSLFRAMANSDDLPDHYSKGQMYLYLSFVNSSQNCSGEEYYASMAADEYQKAALPSYYLNAMTKVAESRMRNSDPLSSSLFLDSIYSLAIETQDTSAISDLLLLKASSYVWQDSLVSALSIYTRLRRDFHLDLSGQDYCNLAIISSETNPASISSYLDTAKYLLQTHNDTICYWARAMRAYRNVNDKDMLIASQDSLLHYIEGQMQKDIEHFTISAQKDYTDWRLSSAEGKLQRIFIFLTLSIICFIACVLYIFERHKRNKAIINAKMAEIKVLQMEVQVHSKERDRALHIIRNDSFVKEILLTNNRVNGLTVTEWKYLTNLFSAQLPHFETALRKIVNLSQFELQVCILLKLGIPPSRIASLTDHSASSISETRSRLYFKAFRKKGTTSDWDAFIDSI